MTRLNQVLAVSKTAKTEAQQAFTRAYHQLQQAAPLSGIVRTYTPKDDDGERLPSESQLVQLKAHQVIADVKAKLGRMFEIVSIIDDTNRFATADIIVDGQVLVESVPSTHLLWLEKQLVDLRTFIAKLPVLDPAEEWALNPNTGVSESAIRETHRSKKVLRNHVKAEATDRHPAQVDVYTEDIVVGYWATRKLSGAMRQTDVNTLMERVGKLQEAVKKAREYANGQEVTAFNSAPVLSYLFG